MFTRSLVIIACLALIAPSVLSQTSVTSWTQVNILSVTSPNCTAYWNTAINCVFPALLIVTTSGWGALNPANTFLILSAPDGSEATGGGTNGLSVYPGDGGANVTLQGVVMPVSYSSSLVASAPGVTAPLLNVSIFAWGGGFNGRSSPAAPLVSFAYDSGPTLTSISGCQGGGLSTTNCNPSTAILTFAGSGFRWYSNPGAVQLWIGTRSFQVANNNGGNGGGGFGQASLTVQSDTQMTLNLAMAYTYLLLPTHYGGTIVPIFFSENRYVQALNTFVLASSNSLNISFIPQPNPVVQSISTGFGLTACTGTNGTGPFYNCIPGVSYLNIFGNYMYDMSVYVGGTPCLSLVVVSASQIRCLLPPLSSSGSYAITLSDPTAQTVVNTSTPAIVNYLSGPSISSITTCTDVGVVNMQGFFFGGYCNEGQTITISGNSFPLGSVAVSITWNPNGNPNFRPPWGQNNITVACLYPTVVSATSITCTLPVLSQQTGAAINASLAMYGSGLSVQASFMSGSIVSNILPGITVFNYPSAPVITSVVGCTTQSSALALSNCASGATLTISGSGFSNNATGYTGVGPVTQSTPNWNCVSTLITANQVVCQLPAFNAQVSPVQSGVTYALAVYVFPFGSFTPYQSNVFRIDFTPLATTNPTTSSSSSLSTAAIIAIAIVVPVVVIACLIALCFIASGRIKQCFSNTKDENFNKQVDSETAAA